MVMSSQPAGLAEARDLLASGGMFKGLLVGAALGACGGGSADDLGNADAATVVQCVLPTLQADAGSLAALEAQRCNVMGSMGAIHWYRLLGTLPSGAMDIVQLELWPSTGSFAGGSVHTGTFTISGDDTDPKKCGVCLRAVGHHGGADQMNYFASAGTVQVDSFGDAPTAFTATITNAMFHRVDATGTALEPSCPTMLDHVAVSGPTVNAGGGGGGGGGTGGGSGASGCPSIVGDL